MLKKKLTSLPRDRDLEDLLTIFSLKCETFSICVFTVQHVYNGPPTVCILYTLIGQVLQCVHSCGVLLTKNIEK